MYEFYGLSFYCERWSDVIVDGGSGIGRARTCFTLSAATVTTRLQHDINGQSTHVAVTARPIHASPPASSAAAAAAAAAGRATFAVVINDDIVQRKRRRNK